MGLEKPSRIFFHGGYQSSSGDNHDGGSSDSASNGRRQRTSATTIEYSRCAQARECKDSTDSHLESCSLQRTSSSTTTTSTTLSCRHAIWDSRSPMRTLKSLSSDPRSTRSRTSSLTSPCSSQFVLCCFVSVLDFDFWRTNWLWPTLSLMKKLSKLVRHKLMAPPCAAQMPQTPVEKTWSIWSLKRVWSWCNAWQLPVR